MGKIRMTKHWIQRHSQPKKLVSLMQFSKYYHILFLWKLIVFTVNEHKNICIAGLNRHGGYATDWILFPCIKFF